MVLILNQIRRSNFEMSLFPVLFRLCSMIILLQKGLPTSGLRTYGGPLVSLSTVCCALYSTTVGKRRCPQLKHRSLSAWRGQRHGRDGIPRPYAFTSRFSTSSIQVVYPVRAQEEYEHNTPPWRGVCHSFVSLWSSGDVLVPFPGLLVDKIPGSWYVLCGHPRNILMGEACDHGSRSMCFVFDNSEGTIYCPTSGRLLQC